MNRFLWISYEFLPNFFSEDSLHSYLATETLTYRMLYRLYYAFFLKKFKLILIKISARIIDTTFLFNPHFFLNLSYKRSLSKKLCINHNQKIILPPHTRDWMCTKVKQYIHTNKKICPSFVSISKRYFISWVHLNHNKIIQAQEYCNSYYY